jgi:hypothetical protein
MRGRTLALVVALALGLAGLIWRSASSSQTAPRSEALPRAAAVPAPFDPGAGALAQLGAQLAEERAARQALAEEVASLRTEVAKLSGAASSPVAALPPGHPALAPGAAPPAGAPEFDEQALLDAGFGEREAQQLRERLEQQELERLYLRDRAVREGWLASPRFVQESSALDAKTRGLREELGDERYDWLLFASGQSNRVVVQSVLESSPAGTAGMRAGDAIVSYADARLFDAVSLRDATTQGRPGETVPVEISRDGETLRVFVPRGPLGVRLEESRVRPTAKARG